jgi:F-type H+-transporting ATPase subunit b
MQGSEASAMTRPDRAVCVTSAALTGLLAAYPAHAAEGGLRIVPDPLQLTLLIVLFLLLVPTLNSLVFRPLLGVLEERERRIDGARTKAGELAERAAQLVERHDQAVSEVREAANAERASTIEEARREHQSALGAARAHAEREIVATREDVTQALQRARAALRADAEPLAREVAERLLGRSLA